jgi:hypothetical protein
LLVLKLSDNATTHYQGDDTSGQATDTRGAQHVQRLAQNWCLALAAGIGKRPPLLIVPEPIRDAKLLSRRVIAHIGLNLFVDVRTARVSDGVSPDRNLEPEIVEGMTVLAVEIENHRSKRAIGALGRVTNALPEQMRQGTRFPTAGIAEDRKVATEQAVGADRNRGVGCHRRRSNEESDLFRLRLIPLNGWNRSRRLSGGWQAHRIPDRGKHQRAALQPHASFASAVRSEQAEGYGAEAAPGRRQVQGVSRLRAICASLIDADPQHYGEDRSVFARKNYEAIHSREALQHPVRKRSTVRRLDVYGDGDT